ncbi:MAG: tRNA lysidine(34) synthetase TilS, partial [Aquabacterium sp.]|nr:tRNA lysidine(34) synthetase TilS [Aquabacterium sp.]
MSGDASQPRCVAVAFSGGRDSTALLHATARAALAYPGTVVLALHVHHGLSSHADDWLAHAEQVCADWAMQGMPVRLVSRRVQVDLTSGASVEAQARQVRYRALADMAKEAGCGLVLLAHHRRDQAETFLLQALRGAGLNGLAAMPPDAVREGVRWVRPWLAYPREAVEAYVAHHTLRWVDDDSNTQVRFARNRLRLGVWPGLIDAFPQAEASFAASARRLQDVLPAAEVWRAELVASLLV